MTTSSSAVDQVYVEFTGKALPLFGRGFLVTLLSLLVVPAPWIATWFYKWFLGRLQLSDGTSVSFEGRGGEVWFPFMAVMLLMLVSQSVRYLPILIIPINCIFWLMIFRWIVRSVKLGCGTPLTFTGGYWPYLGWSLIVVVSIFTIIGWGWASAAMFRWFCRNICGGKHRLEFTGNGWNILWRTFATVLSFIFILPIPWTTLWLVNWYMKNILIGKAPVDAMRSA